MKENVLDNSPERSEICIIKRSPFLYLRAYLEKYLTDFTVVFTNGLAVKYVKIL